MNKGKNRNSLQLFTINNINNTTLNCLEAHIHKTWSVAHAHIQGLSTG